MPGLSVRHFDFQSVNMRLELVRDWMTRDLIVVSPDTTLPEADKLLVAEGIRRLPVVENGRLVGIVTYGDIRGARPSSANSLSIWEMQFLMAQLTVAEIMTPDPITVLQDATIGEAAQHMLTKSIGGLPVLDESGELAGIITESDIFRMVVRDWLRTQEDDTAPYAHYG